MSEESPSAADLVDVLASREDVLTALESGPRDIRDLRDDLDCSRSTVYKAVRELQSRELVEGSDGGYELTLLGRVLYRRYRTFIVETGNVLDYRALLSALPPDLPLDPSIFSNATVTVADRMSPDKPVDALESFIGEAERFRCFAPVQRARYYAYAQDLIESEVRIEMVTRSEVVEYAIANHPDEMREILESPVTTHYETDDPLPFGLVVVDEPERRVGVTLYDAQSHLRGFVASDDPRAYEWGEETYRSYRERATKLVPNQV